MDFDQCACSGKTLGRLVQPAIMGLLAHEPLHGYLLVQRLSTLEMFRDQSPDPTGVYRVLRAMEEDGLVTSAWAFGDTGPARRRFELTASGSACLARWTDTLKQYAGAIDGLLATIAGARGQPKGEAVANAGNTPGKTQARYIMIGGFLGAGKTTAILKLAAHLHSAGQRVGLITNDQSVDLVDTARVKAAGFAVEEITGGCFCCKFDSLVAASRELTRQTAPDVLIAEPVGSCTDLKATVSYPLRQMYGDDYRVSPLSVLVDPQRCARILGLAKGASFSEKVVYVYRKQLEEAEILVVNKIDLVDAKLLRELADALRNQFPQAQVMEVSCTTGKGLQPWFDRMMTGELGKLRSMDVDYDVYADGEALLGWLNARASLKSDAEFDGNAMLISLTRRLRDQLSTRGIEIAHLKMTLTPDEGPDLASVSLTRTAGEPAATHTLKSPLSRGSLMINLRAEADPELLKAELLQVIGSIPPVRAGVQVLAAFRPGRPNPTHRMAQAVP
jgi:Ni2+-binding GTPase involved in maturation of urease and hydrogenase